MTWVSHYMLGKPLSFMCVIFCEPSVCFSHCVQCVNFPILCIGDYSTEPTDVPQNYKRAVCDLSVADRLALYDHVIQKAIQQNANSKSSSNEDLYVDLVSKIKKGGFFLKEQNKWAWVVWLKYGLHIKYIVFVLFYFCFC